MEVFCSLIGLILLPFGFFAVRRFWRARRDVAAGREQQAALRLELHRLAKTCPSCGYFVRADTDRCPECGEVLPSGRVGP